MKKLESVFEKVITFLDGYKTYIGLGVVFIGGGLRAIEKVDEEIATAIITVGTAIAGFGFRHALKKLTAEIRKDI